MPAAHGVIRAAAVGAAFVYVTELWFSVFAAGAGPYGGFAAIFLTLFITVASLPALVLARVPGPIPAWLFAAPITLAVIAFLRFGLHVLNSIPLEATNFPAGTVADTAVGAVAYGAAALISRPPISKRRLAITMTPLPLAVITVILVTWVAP